MKLSHTKLSTYRQCPKRYEYKYVLGLPEPETPELRIGSEGHQVLERYYRGDEKIFENSPNDVFDILKDYPAWASEADAGLQIISTEKEVGADFGDYQLTGRVDAIATLNGESVLLEHKFKKQWNPATAWEQYVNDDQNKMYALLTGIHYVIYNLIRTEKAKTRPNYQRFPVMEIPQHEVDRYKVDVDTWHKVIVHAEKNGLFPRNRGYLCSWCPFKERCFKEG